MKDINIVLLNYFCKDDILRAVESILWDIRETPYDVHVTVADNSNNEDGIREDLSARYPSVLYVNTGKNMGFGKGNTIGFQAMPARYYFALNRDTIIPENSRTIERIIAFMDDHPKVGAMGPKLLNMDGTLQHSCYRFDFSALFVKPFKQLRVDLRPGWGRKNIDRLLMKDFAHDRTQPVDWVLGAAIVARREAIERVSWFDERYFMYFEDCDWCRTMWEHGWPVYYVHDIVIHHRYTRGSSSVPGVIRALFQNKLARAHLASWLRYLWKWRGKHKFVGRI